jgi:DNA-binding response OmpR family regulator
MSKHILVIEDDVQINQMLETLLKKQGYWVRCAYSGTEGLLVHDKEIDLILLDLMLPGKSGEEIIGELKQKHPVPVIVMSAIHDVSKKVDLFSLGADDYLTKPFHNEELLARIAVRLRPERKDFAASDQILSHREITINRGNHSVTCAEREIELSKHEFELLWLLMEHPGQTCTKSVIYDRVWDDENSADDNTLNVHISKIRKKLRECNPAQEYIETVWGIGYRMKQN